MQIPRLILAEKAHPKTIREFVSYFSDPEAGIRCWLGWDILKESNATVRELLTEDKEVLGNLETVWYKNEGGAFTTWDDQRSRRILISELGQEGFPDFRHSERIAKFKDMLDETPSSTAVSVPVIQIGESLVLLDGNHRTAAIHQSLGTHPLRLLIIEGAPQDPFVFPDMIHGTHEGAEVVVWDEMCERVKEHFTK